ncbi:hypothetical protein FRC04_003491 [Tulasnella sp. 424]|nr:hypothetical protein FRC04_003491 [Tulasnella sp. 424]KAG8962160.1 hypothetical protein FRC05_005501 [Tulasnella sp. 425]
MKPPSKDAISKALDILLESIGEQNGYSFPSSCTTPLSGIPLEELATYADALSSAKLHLADEADKLICQTQHRRNLAAPIHRLPEEIFKTILEMTETDVRDLLLWCQVGRLWHATIFNSPRLWTRMYSGLSPKMARWVLNLSKGLPLSLHWDAVDKRYGPIMDIAAQNSTRFKSMKLRGGLSKPLDIRRLLTSPTPALESLTAEVTRGWVAPAPEVVLSEGAPLKHLTLTNLTLTIDPHRLSSLITLFLDGSAIPASLGTLLQILSASAQLEQLTLLADTRVEDSEVPQPGPLVTLPRLGNLELDCITDDYCMALLASIYTPACSRIYVYDASGSQHVDSLDALVWKPGSVQAVALLGFNSSLEPRILGVPETVSMPQISTTISVARSATLVRVEEKDSVRSRHLHFGRSEPLKLLKRIGESLPHRPSLSISLPLSQHDSIGIRPLKLLKRIGESLRHRPSLSLSRPLSQHDSIDLGPWSSTLESLELSDYKASLSAMEQLSQCIATPYGTGVLATESWMCPNLRFITLHIPGDEEECAIYIAALRLLVRKRWSGEDGGLAPAIQPDRFEIISPRYRELQDVESEIQRVLPSFWLN